MTLSYSTGSWAQINEDSLRQSILRSVQHPMDMKNLSKMFDSSKKWSSFSPVDLKKLLEGINKDISAARTKGDMGSLSKGYVKLSSLDSIRGNYKGAYENYKLYASYRDSLQKKEFENKQLQAQMQRDFEKKQSEQRLEKEKEDRKNSTRQILLFSSLLAFIIIAATFFIAYKREQKGKKLVHAQKEEIEKALSELRSTQALLIQSEKMASLGELTAGIAHEIQNPLNFVNNFSEVNTELIGELKTELTTGNEQQAIELADDIQNNEEKINFHGKRADAIVKSMLQHSRSSSGKKELTDISALADEYLRLAYHGLRAKDKSFNAKFETDFDPSLPKINLVPQDIGRVILNLINNSFYAVGERRGAEGTGYEPTVRVTTKKLDGGIAIIVSDNGNGIPQNVIDKIFQPFFTTKPTGQGTGLGLSLSYDIVKAHGGELRVETKKDQGTTFIIEITIAQ